MNEMHRNAYQLYKSNPRKSGPEQVLDAYRASKEVESLKELGYDLKTIMREIFDGYSVSAMGLAHISNLVAVELEQ